MISILNKKIFSIYIINIMTDQIKEKILSQLLKYRKYEKKLILKKLKKHRNDGTLYRMEKRMLMKEYFIKMKVKIEADVVNLTNKYNNFNAIKKKCHQKKNI